MSEDSILKLVNTKNRQFIALNKPAAMPVQPDPTGDMSLLQLAEIYCKMSLGLVHRIDRPASGLVLFAKTDKALADFNEQFRNKSIEKTYLAVVKQAPPEQEGELRHFLRKQSKISKAVIAKAKDKNAKEAVLRYKVLAAIDNYTLLQIQLETGRYHQIRAQLAAIGCPIKGDVKYGFKRGNKDRSIHLHAWKMALSHPITKERVVLEAPIPEEVVWQAFEWPNG